MAWSISNAMMRNYESLHYSRAQGGGILGGHLLGWRTVCAVEYNAYARSVLLARQNDGTLPTFPVWDDVRTFDGKPWRGIVDVVSGGFPCQDISGAGTGAGIDGERSGLWGEMRRIVSQVRPRRVYVENSPMLTSRGLGRVLGDLAEMGFDAEWGVISAADTGAPHLRERIWILADRDGELRDGCRIEWQAGWIQPSNGSGAGVADANGFTGDQGRLGDSGEGPGGRDSDRGDICAHLADSSCFDVQRIVASGADSQERRGSLQRPARSRGHGFGRWPTEPDVGRVVNGMANRVDRLKAIGNGQVPRVAATAWEILA